MTRQTKWEQARIDLRTRIENGYYPPGTVLPKHPDLAAELGCSEGTVRRALDALAREGLVKGVPGRGTTVLPRVTKVLRTDANRATAQTERGFYADVRDAGLRSRVVTTREYRPAPEHVAEILGVPVRSPLLVRDRVQGVQAEDDGPVTVLQTACSWYLPEITEALPILWEEVTGPGGMLARFEELGLVIEQRDDVIPALATKQQCEVLGLTAPAPVCLVTRTTRDQSGRALEVTDLVVTARNVLSYTR
ncbi:GntR family transcriptional regulator [Kitasatospora sp. NPDC058063]|uniref:GntR family transcriptional regulator n=1 Tax=unclassified Kitasatospora TaxID=2633591 RepID=UPI0036DD5F2A